MDKLYIGLKAKVLSHINYWDLCTLCQTIGAAFITNDKLWQHCIGLRNYHSKKPDFMTYCQYYMRLLKTGTCYLCISGKLEPILERVYKINTGLEYIYYVDSEANLWHKQSGKLIMKAVAHCEATYAGLYILTSGGVLYESEHYFTGIAKVTMSVIYQNVTTLIYNVRFNEIWIGLKDGIRPITGNYFSTRGRACCGC